jgi:hypothetical protein
LPNNGALVLRRRPGVILDYRGQCRLAFQRDLLPLLADMRLPNEIDGRTTLSLLPDTIDEVQIFDSGRESVRVDSGFLWGCSRAEVQYR